MEFDILQGLNEEQRLAVTNTEGYIRVIAGAGSGKTKALTHRYAYLVQDLGISTANILCVTFTNKAANEMKKRIRSMIGDSDTGLVATFHGFCVQLLREDIHTMQYPDNFLVLDTEDTDTILKNVYHEAKVDSRSYTYTMARDMISFRKHRESYIKYMVSLEVENIRRRYLESQNPQERIFYGYLFEQKKVFGLDYDDLILFALHILKNFEEKRIKWQKRLEYIMVDEFQDVSAAQYDLADILSGYHKNLFIVGDPDQTIYSWRGADVNYILNFEKHHENTETIIMDRNYRSSPEILDASNSLISKNRLRIEKNLKAVKENRTPVLYNHARTTKEEAEWIAAKIKELKNNGAELSDITVLYRAHFVSRSLEESFVRHKIPYVLYSGIEFYKRREVKDVLSYLRMIAFGDDMSFLRVVNEPRRNMGSKRLDMLKEYARVQSCSLYDALKENLEQDLIVKSKAKEFVTLVEKYRSIYKEMKITDLLVGILNDSGYEAMLRQSGEDERLDNLAELKQSVYDYEKGTGEETFLEDYLQRVALFSNMDKKERADSVKMMTIHTAKGLEFPYVFVCGLNEGIFPGKHVDTGEKLEEERRLAYVAYTRAEQGLFLSDAEGVNYDGSFRFPSRFIFNIERKYVEYVRELEPGLAMDAEFYISANERKLEGMTRTGFLPGEKVRHKVFGAGEILEIDREQGCYVVQFEKLETTRNMSFSAPLEKYP